MEHLACCEALASEVDRFATALERADATADVATCPGWRVVDVAQHLGRIYRWATELVRLRSPVRITPSSVVLDEREVTPAWIREGGQRLVEELRASDPDDPMWAWGADQHVRYWSRRQLHETLVHRMDVELVSGLDVTASTVVAADAIDELLMDLNAAAAFSPGVRELRGDGQRLCVRETHTGNAWTIALHDGGFAVSRSSANGDATIVGPAVDLLLTVYRRIPLAASLVRVEGDEALAAFWLAQSALE